MSSAHLGEAWRADLRTWLAANLPAALSAAGFVVREATEEGARPQLEVVVQYQRFDRVPGMAGTGRVLGVVALAEPYDDDGVVAHRAYVEALWGLLDTLSAKPGPLVETYLHDVQWIDRESEVRDERRITGWQISTMATKGTAGPLDTAGAAIRGTGGEQILATN